MHSPLPTPHCHLPACHRAASFLSNNVYFHLVHRAHKVHLSVVSGEYAEKIAQNALTLLVNVYIVHLGANDKRRAPTRHPCSQDGIGDRTMESWRKVWREGLAPLLSTNGLEALRQALVTDDAQLLQGATTTPPALQCVQDWPVE